MVGIGFLTKNFEYKYQGICFVSTTVSHPPLKRQPATETSSNQPQYEDDSEWNKIT
jgi:hypothetical protein